jgi:hypothetical protein
MQYLKTRWISMVHFIEHVLFKNHKFFMKMALYAPTIATTKFSFCLFIDVELLLRSNDIMPLLEVVHSLIKFAQTCSVFVWFYCNNQDLWKGCISNVLWHSFFIPRWCVYEFPNLNQLCSWKHKLLLDYSYEYKNR